MTFQAEKVWGRGLAGHNSIPQNRMGGYASGSG